MALVAKVKRYEMLLKHLLPDFLDFLPDFGLGSGARLELLHRQPEAQILVTVLLLHVGHELLDAKRVDDEIFDRYGPPPHTPFRWTVNAERGIEEEIKIK